MIDWTSWMDYGFMKMALAAILIITPLFGLMGTMIVNKKMAYFSDALGHSALTGIAVGVVCGIPGRVPFLDKEFLDVAMTLNPKAKMCPGKEIEKRIVREAFADMLPESVAWRQKEQFSDGVGYSWIDTLREMTAAAVSDEQMKHAAERFPINTPQNKEEYYYRSIFEEYFPSESAARSVPSVPSVACSTAEALAWDAAFKNLNEPSGRAVKGIHEEAYDERIK